MDLLKSAISLLGEVAPSLNSSTSIGKAIDLLRVATPAVIQTAKDLAPMVKTVIDALRNNAATDQQLTDLDALEATLDADYDAASAAAGAEDAAG